jgi:hypothetical protein
MTQARITPGAAVGVGDVETVRHCIHGRLSRPIGALWYEASGHRFRLRSTCSAGHRSPVGLRQTFSVVLREADVTPAGWSGSSESLAAHDVGQEGLIHDDDEETTHPGAGGP